MTPLPLAVWRKGVSKGAPGDSVYPLCSHVVESAGRAALACRKWDLASLVLQTIRHTALCKTISVKCKHSQSSVNTCRVIIHLWRGRFASTFWLSSIVRVHNFSCLPQTHLRRQDLLSFVPISFQWDKDRKVWGCWRDSWPDESTALEGAVVSGGL